MDRRWTGPGSIKLRSLRSLRSLTARLLPVRSTTLNPGLSDALQLDQTAAGGAITLTPPFLAGAGALFAPSVTPGAVTLTPPLLAGAGALFAPSVTPGAVTLTPPLLAGAGALFAPSVTPGAVTLTPPLLAGTGALFAPSVTPGAITLTPPLLAGTGALFAPSVTPGAVTLTPPLLAGAGALFAPTISQTAGAVTLFPPFLAGAGALFAPTVTVGSVTITAPFLAGIGALFAPMVVPAIPAIPGINWAPPVDLATSAIIGQALRFMRLPPIAMFDPSNPILPALRDAFDLAMDEALGAADWSFASVLAVLAPAGLPLADIADDMMPHTYQAPGDAIMLRRVGDAGTAWRMDRGLLRADRAGPLTVRYTARVTIEAHLPATFRTAVAMQIAAGLGGQYAGAVIAADNLAMQAAQTLKQAMREDARHAAPERALVPANLGYDCGDGDWAMGAVA